MFYLSSASFGHGSFLHSPSPVLLLLPHLSPSGSLVCVDLWAPSPSIEIQIPTRGEQDDQIAGDKGGQDTEVPPPVVKSKAKGLVELVARPICAIFTGAGGMVVQVARPAGGEEVTHILAAGLTTGGGEAVVFGRGTLDDSIVQLGRHHAADQPGEGVELVEPDPPELGYLWGRDGDAAEEGEDDEDEGVEK